MNHWPYQTVNAHDEPRSVKVASGVTWPSETRTRAMVVRLWTRSR